MNPVRGVRCPGQETSPVPSEERSDTLKAPHSRAQEFVCPLPHQEMGGLGGEGFIPEPWRVRSCWGAQGELGQELLSTNTAAVTAKAQRGHPELPGPAWPGPAEPTAGTARALQILLHPWKACDGAGEGPGLMGSNMKGLMGFKGR